MKDGRAGAASTRRRIAATRIASVCSAITRSRQRGRQQIFVMQATQHRSGAYPEAPADPMAGWRVGGVADRTTRPAKSTSDRRTILANAICERVIGTIRRECLDWLKPLSESHLRAILRSWVGHYNCGRPHMALGPGVPAPPSAVVPSVTPLTRHRIGERLGVRVGSVLGGLYHGYLLVPALA